MANKSIVTFPVESSKTSHLKTICPHCRRSTSKVQWDATQGNAIAPTVVYISGRSPTLNVLKSKTQGNSKVTLGWSAWLSGRTSVSGERSFAVLRSTCSRWVTTYVVKPSAIGQPTRPTQPLILSGSINEKWAAIRCSPPHSLAGPSGERLRGKGRHGVVCRLKAV